MDQPSGFSVPTQNPDNLAGLEALGRLSELFIKQRRPGCLECKLWNIFSFLNKNLYFLSDGVLGVPKQIWRLWWTRREYFLFERRIWMSWPNVLCQCSGFGSQFSRFAWEWTFEIRSTFEVYGMPLRFVLSKLDSGKCKKYSSLPNRFIFPEIVRFIVLIGRIF